MKDYKLSILMCQSNAFIIPQSYPSVDIALKVNGLEGGVPSVITDTAVWVSVKSLLCFFN